MTSISDVAAAMSQTVTSAMRVDAAAMEMALAMVWHCLDCDLSEMAGRVVVEHHEGWATTHERRVVVDGRVIHRQWWEQTGECTATLRQEWCP